MIGGDVWVFVDRAARFAHREYGKRRGAEVGAVKPGQLVADGTAEGVFAESGHVRGLQAQDVPWDRAAWPAAGRMCQRLERGEVRGQPKGLIFLKASNSKMGR